MKKILPILILSATIPFASADILEGTTTDMDFLHQTNYSKSMSKIIDTVKSQNSYGSVKYERKYGKKRPQKPMEHAGYWYSEIKGWFDPMADDQHFGEHEINFDNKFFQMEPSQAIYRKNNENL